MLHRLRVDGSMFKSAISHRCEDGLCADLQLVFTGLGVDLPPGDFVPALGRSRLDPGFEARYRVSGSWMDLCDWPAMGSGAVEIVLGRDFIRIDGVDVYAVRTR